MECSDFMQQLRSFKPQSLGSIVARRKSSTTLIFPLPPQACSGKSEERKYKNQIRSAQKVEEKVGALCLGERENFLGKLRLISRAFLPIP